MKIFTVDTTCRHGNRLELGVESCYLCKWEDSVFNRTPPFDVKCIDPKGTTLKKDGIYTVLAVIREGKTAQGAMNRCYLLRVNDDTCSKIGYNVHNFTIVTK